MKTLITTSSYLPQSKSNWKKTSKKVSSIEFSDYGNILEAFSKSDEYECLIIILFFEDIYSSESNKTTELILNSLSNSLKKNKNTYISLSFNNSKNLISSLRFPDNDLIEYITFKEKIYKLSKDNANLFILDMDKRFSELGHVNIFDSRNWYFSHMRISFQGLIEIDEQVSKAIERSQSACKKVLVLDCDNTLWGGVIGEDELVGISIGGDGQGSAYKDFQYAAKKLKKNGILLAIASKNEEKDVWNVFDNHNQMVIMRDDLVSSKINWIEKSQNLIQMSDELDLGLDSFVFWDDNPIEREKIKKSLPEVTVVDVPKNVEVWPELLENLFEFSKIQVTEEDLKKSDQYKSRAKFNRATSNINFDKDNFLKQINLKPELSKINDSSILRASQMSLKTNQFNLRTIRYKENDIKKIMDNKNFDCYILSVKDDFGDHGQIGMFILDYKSSPQKAFLDTFLLSCRILGRDIESWLMQSILNILQAKNIKTLEIEYLKTERNKLVKEFLLEICKDLEVDLSKEEKTKISFPTSKFIVDVDKIYN